MSDSDGYPIQKELDTVASWSHTRGFPELMEFVHTLWWNPKWGWTQEGDTYKISTGGWSGNEDLIGALQDNTLFWVCCWRASYRGGHYEFEVKT